MEVSTPRSPSPKPEPYSSKCGGQAFVLYSKRWMEMIRSQGSSPPNLMILGGTAAQPLRADQSVFSAVQNRVVIGHVESICMLRSATRYDPLPIICSVFPVLQPCTANGHCQGIPMSSSSIRGQISKKTDGISAVTPAHAVQSLPRSGEYSNLLFLHDWSTSTFHQASTDAALSLQ